MAKRVADNYLTHDNWDKEDENDKEEPGEFQQAGVDVLKQRKIKKARRRAPLGSREPPSTGGAFANFGGLTAKVTKTLDVKSQFSFLTSNGSKPAEGIKKDVLANKQNSNKTDEEKKESEPVVVVNTEYNRHLSALNKSVSDWISKHVTANPLCDLSPVFRDYKKHLNQIEEKYLSSQSESSQSSQEPTKQETSFKLTGFDSKPSNPAFPIETKMEQPSVPAVTKPTFGGFNTSTTQSPFTGFSFGQNKSESGFKFGSSMVSGEKAPEQESTTEKQDENTEEEDKPPTPVSTNIQEEGAFYTKRCKLFYKKDGNYCERGVGNIYLKKMDGKTQLLMRADTSLGNILLNINLQSSIPTERLGKNNVMVTCIPNPPIDVKDGQKVAIMLIRVKTSEDADELLKLIDENKS